MGEGLWSVQGQVKLYLSLMSRIRYQALTLIALRTWAGSDVRSRVSGCAGGRGEEGRPAPLLTQLTPRHTSSRPRRAYNYEASHALQFSLKETICA